MRRADRIQVGKHLFLTRWFWYAVTAVKRVSSKTNVL